MSDYVADAVEQPDSAPVWDDYKRMATMFARKAVTRAQKVGINLELDDAIQEMAITFLNCQAKFNPELGIKFSTYFWHSCSVTWGRIERKNAKPFERFAVRLDDHGAKIAERIGSWDEEASDDEPVSDDLESGLPDWNAKCPEAAAIKDEQVRQLKRKAPMISKIISIQEEMPDDMREELKALECKNAYSRLLGLTSREVQVGGLTIINLEQIFGLNWRARRKIRSQIKAIEHANG